MRKCVFMNAVYPWHSCQIKPLKIWWIMLWMSFNRNLIFMPSTRQEISWLLETSHGRVKKLIPWTLVQEAYCIVLHWKRLSQLKTLTNFARSFKHSYKILEDLSEEPVEISPKRNIFARSWSNPWRSWRILANIFARSFKRFLKVVGNSF